MNNWRNSRGGRQFTVGMFGYIVAIMVVTTLFGRGVIENTAVAVLVALLPVLPFLFAMSGIVGHARSQDEFHRQIYLESVLITALLTIALAFSYGLMEMFELVPHIPLFWIAPFMIVVWGVTNVLIGRRYGG